jgi:hypothetical protein
MASQQNAKQIQQIVRDLSTSPIDIAPPRNVDEVRHAMTRVTELTARQQEQWKMMLETDHRQYIPLRNVVRLQSIFDKHHIHVTDGLGTDILTERVSY